MIAPFRIFIGWDKREPIAYDVAKFSLERHASIPVDVKPIKLHEMQARKLYWREQDPLASTEFTYTRFLTPKLAGYSGWALFCDCDFLFLADIAGLAAYAHGDKAVYCVQHDYRPTETTKMDGAVQTVYPRKNWSSLMLFNSQHPSVRALTPDVVNRESGGYLHRMQWVDDATSAHYRSNGTGSRAGTKSLRAACQARSTSPAAARGSSNGRTWTMAIFGLPKGRCSKAVFHRPRVKLISFN